MHWLDILILTIVLFFFLIGVSRGLINQIFSLAAVVGGIISGLLFYDLAGKLLIEKNLVETQSSALLIGFISVVILAFVIIQILGWIATRLIGKLHLGWLNRLAGGVVGIVIGVVVTFLVLSWLNISVITSESAVNKSKFFPHVKNGYDTIIVLIPDDLGKGYEQAKKRIREEGEKALIHIKESDKPQSVGPKK